MALVNCNVQAMGSAFPDEYRRFLKKLKAARVEAGLNQVDVAKRLKKPEQQEDNSAFSSVA
jgi:hypothetical protein